MPVNANTNMSRQFVLSVLATMESYIANEDDIYDSNLNYQGYELWTGHVCRQGIQRVVQVTYTDNLIPNWSPAEWCITVISGSREEKKTDAFVTINKNNLKLIELLTQVKWDYYLPCSLCGHTEILNKHFRKG